MPDLLQTPPSTSVSLQPVDAMVDEVASLVGGIGDTDTRERALVFLDRAADRLNMAGIWIYRFQQNTWTAGTPASATVFTDACTTLTKPSDWFTPINNGIVYDSDGQLIQEMLWMPWDEFDRRRENPATPANHEGVPSILSMRSPVDDDIYIWPPANTGDCNTITLGYAARVQRASEVSSIVLTNEVREALIMGAEYYMMRLRYAKYPNIWQPFEADFFRSVEGAKAADRRWLGGGLLAAQPDLAGSPDSWRGVFNVGTVYLRMET